MIRTMTTADRPMVASSWLKSYANSARIAQSRYWPVYSAVVDGILDRSPVSVLVNPEDPAQILAWMCHEPRVLHYIYVKAAFRDGRGENQPGVALGMLKHGGFSGSELFAVTFYTSAWARYALAHNLNYLYVRHNIPRFKSEDLCE